MVRVPAIIKSVVFHVAIVAGFVVTMPYLSRDIAPEQPVLTVDIVNTVDETNLNEGFKAKAEPKPQPVKEVEAEEKPTPPPPPPAPAPAPEPPAPEEVKVAEALPVPSEKPKATPPPPKVKPVPKKLSAPPKRPTRKSPEFKKRQQQQAQLTSKLQDLTERKKQQRRAKQEQDKKKQETEDKLKKLLEKQTAKKQDNAERQEAEEKMEDLIGQALNTPRKTSGALGATVIDQLRNHLAICWSPPPGAAGADSLIVDIIVRLNHRAEVQDVEIVDKARMNRDGTFKAAARAARRAIVDCSPLPLPLDNHDKWKELQFEFDPRFITRS